MKSLPSLEIIAETEEVSTKIEGLKEGFEVSRSKDWIFSLKSAFRLENMVSSEESKRPFLELPPQWLKGLFLQELKLKFPLQSRSY